MKLIILFVVFSTFALPEDAPKPAARQISIESRALFWRALAEQAIADAQAKVAHERFQAVREVLIKFCGGPEQFAADKSGEPTCVPKPDNVSSTPKAP